MPVHGATCWGWLSPRGRILSRAGIGVLTWFIPPDLVDDAVGDGHRVAQRWVWAPPEMQVDLGPLCRLYVMPEVALPGGGMSIKVVRLDCSAPCTRSDLKLFDQLAGSAPRTRTVDNGKGPGDWD